MAVDRKRIYHKRDRLRQVRAFCHAARLQSITGAAVHLGITPSAVSVQVRDLEHELEAELFERSGPRIALSSAGERLFDIAWPLVQSMDLVPEVCAKELGDSISDELRIAGGPGVVGFVLPPYIKRFRDENPNVRLSVSISRVGDALRLLSANEVDLALGAEAFGSEDCIYYPAFSYKLVLITSLGHPLAGRESVVLREAARYPAVVPHLGTYARQVGEAVAREHGIKIDVAVEARGWGVIKAYVEVGLGVSVVPDICVTERDWLSVIALRDCSEPQSFGFFARAGRRLPLAAERLIETVDPNLLDSARRPVARQSSG